MNKDQLYFNVVNKVLEVCGADKGSSIYSLIPSFFNELKEYAQLELSSVGSVAMSVNSAVTTLGGSKRIISKNSTINKLLNRKKYDILNKFSFYKNFKTSMIPRNIPEASVAFITPLYLESIFKPMQFFIPYSSNCTGEWKFWDAVDYIEMRELMADKSFITNLNNKTMKDPVWKTKMSISMFPRGVHDRLKKEKLLNKELDPSAMVKAMVIRMAERTKPNINYEITDLALRDLLYDLGINKYLRIDREALFCRMLEETITKNVLLTIKK